VGIAELDEKERSGHAQPSMANGANEPNPLPLAATGCVRSSNPNEVSGSSPEEALPD